MLSSQPAVSEDIQGVTQKGTPTFASSDPTVKITPDFKLKGEDGNPATTIPAKDTEGNEIGTYTVVPATGEVTFVPKKEYTGKVPPVPATVIATASNGGKVEGTYTPKVVPVVPTAEPKTTTDIQGATQTVDASSLFAAGKATVNGKEKTVPLNLDSLTLLNEAGQSVKTLEVSKAGKVVGTYTLENGVITFVPAKDFSGTAPAVEVQVADANGTTVKTTYTPVVVPV
ncbi:hypothetical protein HMPREF0044_0004, partial [Gleimia coleocanis DSM 15436]